MAPFVSIVVPVYNAEKYIERTLASIFAQSFTNYEVIVVDDGSTDQTPVLLDAFKDKIIYIRQENSGGPASPRNKGIMAANGQYIALFDSDDLMFEKKLENDVQILENNPDICLVFSNFILLEGESPSLYSWFEKQNVKLIIDRTPKIQLGSTTYCFSRPIYDEILENNFIGTSTVVVRKTDIIETGLFDESLVGIEDRDMWLRLSKADKIFAFNTEVLSYYRFIEGSMSRQTRNLVSRLDFYHRLLKGELSHKNNKVVRNRLGEIYLQYALVLRNKKNFLTAIAQNIKSLHFINYSNKHKSAIELIKIVILVFLPKLSDSLNKD